MITRTEAAAYRVWKLFTDEWEAVGRAIIAKAKEGDMTAANIIASRVAPMPRGRQGRQVRLGFPEIRSITDLLFAMVVVSKALSDGIITVVEANMYAGVFERWRQILESTDLDKRIRDLEKKEKYNVTQSYEWRFDKGASVQ